LRLFSFGGYGLALAAMALVVFGAYDSDPQWGFALRLGLVFRPNVFVLSLAPKLQRVTLTTFQR